MAATFAALDDETAHAFVKVMGQKAGGRGMGEGRDALRLEIQDLVDAAPGDDRVVGLHFVDGVDLRFQDLGIGEAQNPDAPGPVAQQVAGLGQQLFGAVAIQQGQRGKGQRATLGDAQKEFRHIRHAGHRPLKDRIADAHRPGQRPAFGQDRPRSGGGWQGFDGALDGTDQTAEAAVTGGKGAGERQTLPGRGDVARCPTETGGNVMDRHRLGPQPRRQKICQLAAGLIQPAQIKPAARGFDLQGLTAGKTGNPAALRGIGQG